MLAPSEAGMVAVSTPLLQVLVMPSAGSVDIERFGALMIMVEPDRMVAVKFVSPTVIVSIVELALLTFTETLLIESTTSVESVTSL